MRNHFPEFPAARDKYTPDEHFLAELMQAFGCLAPLHSGFHMPWLDGHRIARFSSHLLRFGRKPLAAGRFSNHFQDSSSHFHQNLNDGRAPLSFSIWLAETLRVQPAGVGPQLALVTAVTLDKPNNYKVVPSTDHGL